MGTRSLVAIETAGKIKSTYVHFDGYLTGVGGVLLRHYNSRKGAQSLAKLGYASSLRATLQETIDGTVEHNRGIKPEKADDRAELLADAYDCDADYTYLFSGGRWLVAETTYACGGESPQAVWLDLVEAHAADMAGENV